MTYVVTGATGFLGGHLLDTLVATGRPVRALVRDARRAEELRYRGVDVRLGDIRDAPSVVDLVADVSVVFHAAAARGSPPPRAEVRSTNRAGLQNLVKAIGSTGFCARLIFVSGLSVLGLRDLVSATEDFPLQRSGDIEADTKIEAERLIRDAHESSGLDAVILRPGIVYGPGDENLSQLRRAVQEGKFAYIGSRENIVPLVHVGDFVQLALMAANRPETRGRIYHVTDGSTTKIQEIVEILAELTGSPKPQLVLPYFVPYIGCVLFETFNRLHLRSKPGPIDRAALRFLGTSRSVSIQRARDELGFSPQVSIRDGLQFDLKTTERTS
jgi:dihydroflavonol-4-reductase